MRYVLLDRITLLEPPERARGVKCVSLAEDQFADHFPGLPIMPGALIIEAIAQLAGALLEAGARKRDREVYAVLAMIDRTKFRRAARPGDRIELEATMTHFAEEGGRVVGLAKVDGDLIAETELTFTLAPLTNPRLIAQRKELFDMWTRTT